MLHRLTHLFGNPRHTDIACWKGERLYEWKLCWDCGRKYAVRRVDVIRVAPPKPRTEPIAQVGQGDSRRDITGDESPWPMIAVLVAFGVAMACLYCWAGGVA
jgi:hypothetical protein